MKRFAFILAALLLLSACTLSRESTDSVTPGGETSAQEAPSRKKPKIPQKPEEIKEPTDETSAILEILKETPEEVTTITREDIERGWYYAAKEQKKFGTPPAWIWMEKNGQSLWVSPNAIEALEEMDQKALCETTGGTYRISCLDHESENCEYIPETFCQCQEVTLWESEEGCLLIDKDDQFIRVSEEELQQGYYLGEKHQKKQGTPEGWIWNNSNNTPRWQRG